MNVGPSNSISSINSTGKAREKTADESVIEREGAPEAGMSPELADAFSLHDLANERPRDPDFNPLVTSFDLSRDLHQSEGTSSGIGARQSSESFEDAGPPYDSLTGMNVDVPDDVLHDSNTGATYRTDPFDPLFKAFLSKPSPSNISDQKNVAPQESDEMSVPRRHLGVGQLIGNRGIFRSELLKVKPTFEEVLADPLSHRIFESHCRADLCTENLDFLDALARFDEADPADNAAIAKQIHRDFVASGKVNLSSENSKWLTEFFAGLPPAFSSVPPTIFFVAGDEIRKMFKDDVYPRFVRQVETILASEPQSLYQRVTAWVKEGKGGN